MPAEDFYYCKKCRVHLAANFVIRDEETTENLCPNCESHVTMTANNQEALEHGGSYEKRPQTANSVKFAYYAPDGRQKETIKPLRASRRT